ncbi:cyclic pyranopterin monophosphate synthase MoaC [Marinicella sp. S1101]|uniref:cyclic pyranopterin monophosphate synthase MoaC n=1 Tax=Marinicella marina TaxID=2996016 RepID=UPI00226090FD|nr:cyclic pyranopterin monophosphate synthase MoaC [Marinicella marina]MCX7553532.1 cyclic pyranopterin monophosphate synthase MoaC [Marinicella marina]MDJ1140156.1 cyclic pyranopterin monophosphate synthase MoaC [Marinicella marina]
MTDELSHIDNNNNPTMVDVSDKKITMRTAAAQSLVLLPDAIKAVITDNEIHSKKGPVFQTAIIAGVMAAKKTHELIPFCHPLPLESCKIDITTTEDKDLLITCQCKVTAKTGIEMEALTGASVAALTIYDMCKALSHDITITATQLITKSGGKSDIIRR